MNDIVDQDSKPKSMNDLLEGPTTVHGVDPRTGLAIESNLPPFNISLTPGADPVAEAKKLTGAKSMNDLVEVSQKSEGMVPIVPVNARNKAVREFYENPTYLTSVTIGFPGINTKLLNIPGHNIFSSEPPEPPGGWSKEGQPLDENGKPYVSKFAPKVPDSVPMKRSLRKKVVDTEGSWKGSPRTSMETTTIYGPDKVVTTYPKASNVPEGYEEFYEPVFSISKGTDKPNFIERGLNALSGLFGGNNVGKLSDSAKAQALVMHMAKEEGVPLDQFRQSPEFLEKASSSFISMSTFGLAPAVRNAVTGEIDYPATNTPGYIGEALGSLAGLYGGPMIVAGKVMKPVLNFLPQAFQGEKVAARILKSGLRDSLLLAPALGIANVGEALEQVTFSQAAGKIWEGVKSGATIGAIFGTSRGLFPAEGWETGARIFTGLLGLNTYRASEMGGNPFTNRPVGDVLFDIAFDSVFLYKGLPKNMRFEVAEDLKNLNDRIDKSKVPPQPSEGGENIPPEALQQAQQKAAEIEKIQIDLEAKRVAEKAKAALEAKAELEVQGNKIEEAKGVKPEETKPKVTFREFVEAKSIEWPITQKDPKYKELLAEYEGLGKEPVEVKEEIKDEKSLDEEIAEIDNEALVKLGYDENDIAKLSEEQKESIIDHGTVKKVEKEAKVGKKPKKTMADLVEEKPKIVRRKKAKPAEPLTPLDETTGSPRPKALSQDTHPLRDTDVERTNGMALIYKEKIKKVSSSPEVHTRYLINEVNRYLNGEDVQVEKVRADLSELSARASEVASSFDRPEDHRLWSNTVNEAAKWARQADRIKNIRTGQGTQLNMMIPVNELPEQVKGLLKNIKVGLFRGGESIYRNKEVFDSTGFWLGKDNKWRYEIDASEIRYGKFLDKYRKTGDNLGYVKDIVDDKLLQSIPGLNQVSFIIAGKLDSAGSYDSGTKIIRIKKADDAVSFVHELQHAVNDIVGSRFRGSSPIQEQGLLDLKLLMTLRKLAKTKEVQDTIKELEQDTKNKPYHIAEQAAEKASTIGADKEAADIREALKEYTQQGGFENYMKDPGEMEARLASARMKMTPEQRKATPPWETLDNMLSAEGHSTEARGRVSAGHKLYSGIPLDEASKAIIALGKSFAKGMRESRDLKNFNTEEAIKLARQKFTASFVESHGNARRELIAKQNDFKSWYLDKEPSISGYEIMSDMYMTRGGHPKAYRMLEQLRDEVDSGLDKDLKFIKHGLIRASRILDIAKYKTSKQFTFPENASPRESSVYTNLFRSEAINGIRDLTPEEAHTLYHVNADGTIGGRVGAYFEWIKKAVRDAHEEGLITEQEMKDLTSHNYSKTKLVDIFDKENKIKVGGKKLTVYDSGIERLAKGKKTDIYELDSNILALETFNTLYSRIYKNRANRDLYDLALEDKENPFSRVKEKGVKIPENFRHYFTNVFIDGEKKTVFLSDAIGPEWLTSNSQTTYKYAQFMRYGSASPIVKLFATGISQSFALRNLPRDAFHAWFTSRIIRPEESAVFGRYQSVYSPTLPVAAYQLGKHYSKVFKDTILRKGVVDDYINDGGGMELLTPQGKVLFHGKHLEPATEAFYKYAGYLGTTSELLSRVAIRDRVIENRANEKGITVEEASKDKKIRKEATFAARDFMDFVQGGDIIKALDNAYPYLNARIVAMRGFLRALKDQPVVSAYKLTQFALLVGGLYIGNQLLHPNTMKELEGDKRIQGNLVFPLGDIFGFKDHMGETRYPFLVMPIDQNMTFFKTLFEGGIDLMTGKEVDVDGIIHSLKSYSPVEITSLPPSVSGVLGYAMNKDFWLGKDIVPRDEGPFKYELPKMITGGKGGSENEWDKDTPQALVDVGKVTGLSPKRLKYLMGQLITNDNMYAQLLGRVYQESFGELPQRDREFILAESLSKVPVIKAFFKVTNPYSKFASPVEQATDKAVLDRFIENRGLDIRVDAYLYDGTVKRSEINDYMRSFKDIDTYNRLNDVFKFSEKIRELPNHAFWISLKHIPDVDAKARLYVQRLDAANAEERAQLMREVAIVSSAGGIISDEFRKSVIKIRSGK
jgi:hypothetical protein